VNGRIEVTQDEIAEKIDELADLCDVWKALHAIANRFEGSVARIARAALAPVGR